MAQTTLSPSTPPHTPPHTSKKRWGGDRSILVLLVITVLIFVVLSLALPGKFFTGTNLQSMMVQLPEFGILAIAI